jgi:hypothetical protein
MLSHWAPTFVESCPFAAVWKALILRFRLQVSEQSRYYANVAKESNMRINLAPFSSVATRKRVYRHILKSAAVAISFCGCASGAEAKDISADTSITTGTPTARTLADRGTDHPNVKDFGAALDGMTNDYPAFNAARGAAATNGEIDVPTGGFVVDTVPTAGPSTPVLWRLSGNTYGMGGPPVNGLGTDEVETFLGNGGGKFFTRTSSTSSSGPLVRIDDAITHAGGSGTLSSLLVNTIITSPSSGLGSDPWGITSNLVTNGSTNGPSSAEAVAVAGYSTRTGTAGMGEIWGGNFSSTDQSGKDSTNSGSMVGVETDLSASDADDYSNGVRVGQDVELSNYQQSGTASFGYGVRVVANTGTFVERSFSVIGDFVDGFACDLGSQQSGGACLKMAAGQQIDFTADSKHSLAYESDGLSYKAKNKEVARVDDNGNGTFSGQLTASAWFTAPSYVAANLPKPNFRSAGRLAFCSDCLKPGEAIGHGTGMPVFDDGHQQWVTSAGAIVYSAVKQVSFAER